MRRYVRQSWKRHPTNGDLIRISHHYEEGHGGKIEKTIVHADVPRWLYHGSSSRKHLGGGMPTDFADSHTNALAWGRVIHVMNTRRALDGGARHVYGNAETSARTYRFNSIPLGAYAAVHIPNGTRPPDAERMIEAARKELLRGARKMP